MGFSIAVMTYLLSPRSFSAAPGSLRFLVPDANRLLLGRQIRSRLAAHTHKMRLQAGTTDGDNEIRRTKYFTFDMAIFFP